MLLWPLRSTLVINYNIGLDLFYPSPCSRFHSTNISSNTGPIWRNYYR